MNKELEGFKKVVDEIVGIKTKKAADYGNSWRIFGLQGVFQQIGSKYIRLANLFKKGKEPKNESIRDSFRDMAVYCIMAIQLIDEDDTEDKIDELIDELMN